VSEMAISGDRTELTAHRAVASTTVARRALGRAGEQVADHQLHSADDGGVVNETGAWSMDEVTSVADRK
jgi:hypothetical protein